MKKRIFLRCIVLLIGLVFLCVYKKYVVAHEPPKENSLDDETVVSSYYENYYENVQINHLEEELQGINHKYGRKQTISFEKVFSMLMNGQIDEVFREMFISFCENISNEIDKNREMLVKLILLVMVAAIFNTYSSIYRFSYVGEQGFYVTYIMIAILLLQSFSVVYNLAEETINYLNEIVKCLLPALYMSLIMCSGLTTSHMVNSMFLGMLSLIENVLLHVILPGTQIYFLVVVLNQISSVDRFSKLAGLLKQGLQFALKGIVTGIITLNIMKSMLVPIYDNAKFSLFQKGLSVMPGGNSLSGLSTILIGAGVLIKNSVGLTVVIILFVFGSIPLLEIMCFLVIYKVILALVQPISDNRILKGIQGAADSIGILLRATTTSIVLSVLSIAIVIMTTNVRLYVG